MSCSNTPYKDQRFDLTGTYGILHRTRAQYISFSIAQRNFIKIAYILGHKTNLVLFRIIYLYLILTVSFSFFKDLSSGITFLVLKIYPSELVSEERTCLWLTSIFVFRKLLFFFFPSVEVILTDRTLGW